MIKVFNRYIPVKTILLIVTENLLITGVLALLAYFVKENFTWFPPPQLDPAAPPLTGVESAFSLSLRIAVITLVCQISLFYNDVYDLTIVNTRRELTVRALQSFGAGAIVLAALYWQFPALIIRNNVVVAFVVLAVLVLLGWRMLILFAASVYEVPRRVLILGAGELASELVDAMHQRTDLNLKVIGYLHDAPDDTVNPKLMKRLGSPEQLAEVVEMHDIHRVVVALADRRNKLPVRDLLDLKLRGVLIDDAHPFFEKITGKIRTTTAPPGWLVFSEGFHEIERKVRYKQSIDFLLSLVIGALAAPLAVLAAIAVKLESRGPALFRQERVGYRGKLFNVIKFRTMRQDAEALSGPKWAEENDPRITRVGRFLRKSRIDEIPQIWNVIKGDMSFIGPRPERPHFVEMLGEQLNYYQERHAVRPGLTGWAQVRYPYGASVDDALQKLQYDLFYIKNLSFFLDVAILFETGKIVLFGRGR